jgi:NAD(P)-dependent dehydrogenase (short-subunit alcohol dehydrogenase family)
VYLGLEGKVALVTGVSQGIGLACATSLLAEGARVLGTSRSAPPALDGLTHLPLNMTESGAAERAVGETVARLGALDILVNNVGSTSIYSYSAGKAAMDNLTVGLSKEFAPLGVRVVGVAPGPTNTPLWLGPAGVAATVAARTGSAPQEVLAEAIARIPVGRFTTPEEVGDLVTFLASARAATITGTTIRIDGGITPSV